MKKQTQTLTLKQLEKVRGGLKPIGYPDELLLKPIGYPADLVGDQIGPREQR